MYTNFANDNFAPGTTNISHGMAFELTVPPNKSMPPKLIADMVNPAAEIISFAGGSNFYLGNGNYLVNYGIGGHINEFHVNKDKMAEVSLSIKLGTQNATLDSYRAFKSSWHALPVSDPNLVVLPVAETGSCPLRGYVSWNGATDVKDWDVLVGTSPQSMHYVSTIRKMGFETEFTVPSDIGYVQVRDTSSSRCSNIAAVPS